MGGQLAREDKDIIDDCIEVLVVVSTDLNFELSGRDASIISGYGVGGCSVGVGVGAIKYRTILRLAKGAAAIHPTSRIRGAP